MIESKNCSFCYQNSKTNALKSVDLIIYPGECVVLTGKSGCGKTTMTRLFNGLAPSYFCGEMTGSCHTFGLESGAALIEEYVPFTGSVFQNPKTQYFNVDTTAELAFPCENMGIPSRDIQKRVRECAEEFGLGKLLNLLNNQGKAILVITHDEELVVDCCDRVVFLHEKEEDFGRIS